MFISVWVLIPAVAVLIIGVILTIRHIYRIETAMETWQRRAIEQQQEVRNLLAGDEERSEERRTLYRAIKRADAGFIHLIGVAREEANENMQDAARRAMNFFENDRKGPEDAPWL